MAETRVVVVEGDLVKQCVDVIVNPANEYLRIGGGVAGVLADAAGPSLNRECEQWIAEHGPLGPGDAAVTGGGNLKCRWVVHVVGPRYKPGQENPALLREAVRAALDTSARQGAQTVALPAISTGIFGYPLKEAAPIIASECRSWAENNQGALAEIRLIAYSKRAAEAFSPGLQDSAID